MSDFCLYVRLSGGTVDCKGVSTGVGVVSAVGFGVALGVTVAAGFGVLTSTASLTGAQATEDRVRIIMTKIRVTVLHLGLIMIASPLRKIHQYQ